MLYEVRTVSDVPRSLQSCVQPFKRSYSQLTFFNFIKVYTGTTVVPGILYAKILFFFFPSHLLSSPFYLYPFPLSRNSDDPGSHSKLFSPPTHYGSCLAFFIARRFQLFLLSSTRVELCLPTLGAVDPFFILANKFESHHGGIRTDQHCQ